ncbi:uncharacterized protein si:ch73-52p7.1 [Polyodon spathula]|uniref:uncharacterized protein si:ch73-52p7.1 n=1 Tax=Polyodon spathula TaxID=7913 RepID=UPI001B7DEEC7|nr:uncharacterized protein si:ch73-52p7.1 [Polyodon spathula]
MHPTVKISKSVLLCLIWISIPALLLSEFKLAYVTDFSLYNCTCIRSLSLCGRIDPGECDCNAFPFSVLHRSNSGSVLNEKCITVWYTSPGNVALLLNNSEVHHLSLVKCDSTGWKPIQYDYFTVQRLERLTVSYRNRYADFTKAIELGRQRLPGAHDDEASMAVIHLSVLSGQTTLKAYTIQTTGHSNGSFPFPNLSMAHSYLSDASNRFITFVY